MPLNGSGTYNLPSPAFPAIPNTLIKAADYNAVLTDVASALSQAMFRDGQAAFTGPLTLGNQKITSLAAGTADTDAVNKGQLNQLFPIGAVYITANNVNPGTFIGGTWTQIGQGRTLIGVGTLGADTYTAGATGGASTVTLSTAQLPSHSHGGATGAQSADHTHSGTTGGQSVNHTHSGSTSTDPGHTHTSPLYNTGGTNSLPTGAGGSDALLTPKTTGSGGSHSHTFSTGTESATHTHSFTTGGTSASHTHAISAEGGGAAHENRMPYLAVYFWQRTA